MSNNIRYRTENAYGSNVRKAEDVLYYEIFTLGNVDILETLMETALKGEKIADMMYQISDELQNNGFIDDMSTEDKLAFVSDVLAAVSEKTGHNVNYALWLADKDVVRDCYGRRSLDDSEIDAYRTGEVVLSELGYDGTLYGYESLPLPIKEKGKSVAFEER